MCVSFPVKITGDTIHIPMDRKTCKCDYGVSHTKLLIRPSFSLLKTVDETPNHWQRLHIRGKPIHILWNWIGRHHVDKTHILHHETPFLQRILDSYMDTLIIVSSSWITHSVGPRTWSVLDPSKDYKLKLRNLPCLSYTGLVVELEHLKIKTRLTNEKFPCESDYCLFIMINLERLLLEKLVYY